MIVSPISTDTCHGYGGVSMLTGLTMEHNYIIFELYLNNPSLPVVGYIQRLSERFGLVAIYFTIQTWFMMIGSFKGSMRVINRYPGSRNSPSMVRHLEFYLKIILTVSDHCRLVFVEKNHMKDRGTFGTVYESIQRNNPSTPHGCK